MEALMNVTQQHEDKYKNSTALDAHPSLRRTHKKLTNKSINQLNGFSKSRIRRINSISENITSLFKQNQDKLRLYFKNDSLISGTLKSENLQNPDIYSVLSDGVYILIQGSVKIISFPEEKPLPKSSIKEITISHFRKLKISKQSGLKLKDSTNQLIKKNSTNEKTQCFYSCVTLDQPFTVFQCINQNCCSFSNQTILYKLDEDQKKSFKYFQNKQKLRQLIQQNKTFFKTNFMLFHTFLYKRLNFRSQFKVNNVALIKKGTLKVFAEQQKRGKNTELKSHILKQQICELCEPSMLVNGFTYEVSSCQSQIIFIENNDTFEFVKNPEWVFRFDQMINEKMGRKREQRNKLEKKSSHNHFKKHMSKIGRNQSVLPNFMTVHQNDELQIPQFFQSFHIDKRSGQSLYQSKGHRKSFSEIQSTSNTIQTQIARLLPHEKQRKNDMIKMISPYVLISQKMGLKEITKTKSILNERIQNLTPFKTNSPLNLTKVSRNHLNKYQTQYLEPIQLQKYNMQNVPNDRRSLLRFEKFLQDKNQRHYHEKLKQNNQNLLKSHKKSSSELAQTSSSNFFLSLKRTKLKMHISFEGDKSKQVTRLEKKKKSTEFGDRTDSDQIF